MSYILCITFQYIVWKYIYIYIFVCVFIFAWIDTNILMIGLLNDAETVMTIEWNLTSFMKTSYLHCVILIVCWNYGVLMCPLRWRHNGRDTVSNHQPHDCLLNRLFRPRSKKTSKLRVTGLCVGNSPGTGEFPAQMASNAENVSIWWRHHVIWHGFNTSWPSGPI